MTILWWCHVSKGSILINLGGQVFHLSRQKRWEQHFNVVGELRDAGPDGLDGHGLLENIVNDDGGDDADAVPAEDPWLNLPVHSEIVVHLETKLFHTRVSDEWAMLSHHQRNMTDQRNMYLHGVASPVIAFCLGADSLMGIQKLSKVLTLFAKPAKPQDKKDFLQQHLRSALGIEVSLMGSAEWTFPDNDWNSQENILGFAYARIALPNADLRFRRVIMFGLAGPKDKMYYFGVTALGALKDKAVELYNEGTRSSLARKRATIERAGCARDFLQKNGPYFPRRHLIQSCSLRIRTPSSSTYWH